jgi:hypothetical protein
MNKLMCWKWIRVVAFLSGVLTSMGSAIPLHAQNDKQFGHWVLRATAPAAGTRYYEDRGCGLIVSTREGTNGSGVSYFSQYAAKVDGKDYPRVVRGAKTAGTIAFTKVDEYTIEYTLKEDGKVTGGGTTTVSQDGKVLTVTSKGAQGRSGVETYDRAP